MDNNFEEKEIVALFTDIRGFSHMFEVLPAEKVYTFTNRYFKTAYDIIIRFHGTLDNIVGDGLLAVWGKDSPNPKAPFYAVRSALEMRMALLRQNIQYKWKSHFPLEIGIGIAMGKALHCLVGPRQHAIDTVYGKPVILASRLGDIAKHNQILVSEQVAKSVRKWARIENIQKIEFQGFKEPVSYHKIDGLMDFTLKNGERRKNSFIRYVVPAIVAMVFKKSGIRKPVILRNISPSGAGLEIVQKKDIPFKRDEEVILDLRHIPIKNISEIEGRVVQVKTISEETDEVRCLWQVGIAFSNIDHEKYNVLKRFNMV